MWIPCEAMSSELLSEVWWCLFACRTGTFLEVGEQTVPISSHWNMLHCQCIFGLLQSKYLPSSELLNPPPPSEFPLNTGHTSPGFGLSPTSHNQTPWQLMPLSAWHPQADFRLAGQLSVSFHQWFSSHPVLKAVCVTGLCLLFLNYLSVLFFLSRPSLMSLRDSCKSGILDPRVFFASVKGWRSSST